MLKKLKLFYDLGYNFLKILENLLSASSYNLGEWEIIDAKTNCLNDCNFIGGYCPSACGSGFCCAGKDYAYGEPQNTNCPQSAIDQLDGFDRYQCITSKFFKGIYFC